MQQYNPYWNQMMGYNPMMNAQQRLAQMEQSQMFPTQMSGSLNGRVVDSFDSISVNDVPMDGIGAVFLKRDNSEIQVRSWGNDGLIRMTTYKPDIAENKAEAPADNPIMTRLDEVVTRLEKIEKSISGKRVIKNAKSNADDVSANDE